MNFLLQVSAGTAIQVLFGFVWYGPIIGDLFLRLAFKTGRPPKDMSFTLCYAVTVVAAFGLNNLVKLLIGAMHVHTLLAAALTSMALWAFGLFLHLPHVFFENRSLVLTLVHEGGHFVLLLVLCMYYSVMEKMSLK